MVTINAANEPTATTGTVLQGQGVGTASAFSTATYPATTTSQQILYSTAANVVGQLTTANSALAATNSSGTLAMRAFSVVRQVFTTPGAGTYTPTAGMLYCDIEVVGGGGGSGGCATTGAAGLAAAAGGGGGGYARKTVSASTIGASKALSVGAGGTAGSAGFNAGGTGGTSSVGSTIVSATGGGGGGGGTAATGATIQIFSSGGVGGSGSSGDFNTTGNPGNHALYGGSTTVATIFPGNGGSSFFGGGAQAPGGGNGVGAAVAGTSYGGGGAGGGNYINTGQIAGAAGAAGIIVITEYVIA